MRTQRGAKDGAADWTVSCAGPVTLAAGCGRGPLFGVAKAGGVVVWVMMTTTTYAFLLTFDVNGASERHSFRVAASTLSAAVTRSLDRLAQEKPEAQFKGLTYYALPVEPSALPLAPATRPASAA